MGYERIEVPSAGAKITVREDGALNIPSNPIIPYIEGDDIGIDITPVMLKVVDAAGGQGVGSARSRCACGS